jgi:tetratricopeptide (TPR) repeat protein
MEQKPDRRKELCDSFRESLRKPISERYYDEDELALIFDYAGDLEDDYIRFEVLLLGARLYPESEMLSDRRAIFYDDFDASLSEKYISDNDNRQSAILDIIKLRNDDSIDATNIGDALDYLISQYDTLSDEDIVQLIVTIREKDAVLWLFQNYERVAEKIEFKQIFYYEAAMLFDEEHLFEMSAKMFDKLVELEPYDANYWRMLAFAYAQLKDYTKAKHALDYCMAINPDIPEAKLLQVNIIGNTEGLSVGCDKMEEIYNSSCHTLESAKILMMMYSELGLKKKLKAFLKTISKEYPDDFLILTQALYHKACNAKEALKMFFELADTSSIDSDAWTGFVLALIHDGLYSTAIEATKAYQKYSGTLLADITLIPMAQYYAGHIDKCMDFFAKNVNDVDCYIPSRRMEFHLFWATILAMTGNGNLAISLLDAIKDKLQNIDSQPFDRILYYKGSITLIKDLKARIKGEIPTDWDTYNPLDINYHED